MSGPDYFDDVDADGRLQIADPIVAQFLDADADGRLQIADPIVAQFLDADAVTDTPYWGQSFRDRPCYEHVRYVPTRLGIFEP